MPGSSKTPCARQGDRALCVVLHDVAPATWPACARLLAGVDALGDVPVTLLVVPEYHRGVPIDADGEFVRAIGQRLERGDEVAMHGCFHWDDVPARNPAAWLRRRLWTAGEGEFGALDESAAQQRIQRGLAPFRRLGWPVRGFVPPAWLLSDGARAALSRSSFAYTSTLGRLYTLPDWRPQGSASLFWSVRSALRRRVFGRLNGYRLAGLGDAPLLRLGIHPVDVAYPEVLGFWLRAIERSLATRAAMTKSTWLEARR
ncbi:MAG TPA: polysaccharide deacetylase family protein [Rhodocyclaceae bacterium]